MWFVLRKKKRKKKVVRANRQYDLLKGDAKKIIQARLDYWAPICQVEYKRVAIRDQKRRWGSCTSLRNLNFNYRLAIIPRPICDYVIVHELCHIKQMNHSQAFWIEVEKILPNYLQLIKELRQIEKQGKKSTVDEDSYYYVLNAQKS